MKDRWFRFAGIECSIFNNEVHVYALRHKVILGSKFRGLYRADTRNPPVYWPIWIRKQGAES